MDLKRGSQIDRRGFEERFKETRERQPGIREKRLRIDRYPERGKKVDSRGNYTNGKKIIRKKLLIFKTETVLNIIC